VTGGVITGLEQVGTEGAVVVHAGTVLDAEGRLVSSGGRVLCVVGTGSDIDLARERAYRGIGKIDLPGSFYRTDIAARLPAPIEV
jgi:phosphoribosylamine--glycine ligase